MNNVVQIKAVQVLLGLPSDGILGPITTQAIQDYQTTNGLVADGVVGQITWNTMFPPQPLNIPDGLAIDLVKLQGVIPNNIIEQLPGVIEKWKINTGLRMAHYLANIANETGNFTVFEEDLYYGVPELISTWGGIFNAENASQYAMHPQKLANYIYSNLFSAGQTLGNGDVASGDGWKYRGKGAIQVTGKTYTKEYFEDASLPADTDPELLTTDYAMDSAGWYWNKTNLNAICDLGSDQATINKVRESDNGGLIGIVNVTRLFNEIYPLIS